MTAMTAQQVGRAAQLGGFSGDAIVTAVAIAKRESGWDPAAVGDQNNPAPGHRSIGLMQINVGPSYNNAGIWFRENPDVLFDPVQNMKAAYEMSGGGTNWRPWSTYRAGIPTPDLAGVKAQLAGVDLTTVSLEGTGLSIPNPLGGLTGGLADLGDLAKFFTNLTRWETWRRVLQLGAGVLLIGWGASAIGNDAIRSIILPKVPKPSSGSTSSPPDDNGADDTPDDAGDAGTTGD